MKNPLSFSGHFSIRTYLALAMIAGLSAVTGYSAPAPLPVRAEVEASFVVSQTAELMHVEAAHCQKARARAARVIRQEHPGTPAQPVASNDWTSAMRNAKSVARAQSVRIPVTPVSRE